VLIAKLWLCLSRSDLMFPGSTKMMTTPSLSPSSLCKACTSWMVANLHCIYRVKGGHFFHTSALVMRSHLMGGLNQHWVEDVTQMILLGQPAQHDLLNASEVGGGSGGDRRTTNPFCWHSMLVCQQSVFPSASSFTQTVWVLCRL
jgi:hypothetical protein